jgi:hypothetical protein
VPSDVVFTPVSTDRVGPYLTVVAVARNDDHGGNLLYRLQLFVSGLVTQCERFRLPTELVLVEWNPPLDRPRLAEVLDWPAGTGYCSVRIIDVPNELHNTLEYSDHLPLFQMTAKNVGIRRARGEFVLATNIDILFSDALMRFLAQRTLRPGFVYRADRFDVPAEIDPGWPIARQLEWCRTSAERVHRREGTLDLHSGEFSWIGPPAFTTWLRSRLDHLNETGPSVEKSLGLRHLPYLRPVPHSGALGRFQDAAVTSSMLASRPGRSLARVRAFSASGIARLQRVISKRAQPSARSTDGELHVAQEPVDVRAIRRAWRLAAVQPRLHTNAAGDFTLMSRRDWETTKGYPELATYAMHIDSLHLYSAYHSGSRERILPFPIYHIEHGVGGSPTTGDGASAAAQAAGDAGNVMPRITDEQLWESIVVMCLTGDPLSLSQPAWGLGDRSLTETLPIGDSEPESSAEMAHAAEVSREK